MRTLVLLFGAMTMAQAQTVQGIIGELERIGARTGGIVAVAAEDLQTGERILVREREMFHAASTMKTPVMVEVFKQIGQGRLALNDSIDVRNEFRSIVDGSPYSMDLGEDSDDSMYRLIGSRTTVAHLVEQMITVSSNLATNILIDRVGATNVTASMRAMGADSIRVLRGVEDGKAFALGLNNETSALDLLVVFRAIATGSAVDKDASAQMIEILLRQKFGEIIPARLPKGVRVAHKTGSITGVEHDSGIVFLPNGRSYVIVILSKNVTNAKESRQVLAELSERVYTHFAGGR